MSELGDREFVLQVCSGLDDEYALFTKLREILSKHCGEPGLNGRGTSEGVVETLERIIRERDELKKALTVQRTLLAATVGVIMDSDTKR